MQTPIPCSLIRGGTSKGLYFKAEDLPTDPNVRDKVLLAIMGSPDTRQIDGMGGAHPLTSKVAIVSPSELENVDVDYLFLQISLDKSEVSTTQNCGNLLAGVAPFAIEVGFVKPVSEFCKVRIRMLNTDAQAIVTVQTAEGCVEYGGEARIDGVPGTASPIMIEFLDVTGSTCGSLFPTGNHVDKILDSKVTCIDAGMPVVILQAADFNLSGRESPLELESNTQLKHQIERIRLEAGLVMNLGNVTHKTVPKMCLVSPALQGGVINTRTFIPHKIHEAIGVLGAVSVAVACAVQGTIAHLLTKESLSNREVKADIEHPSGSFTVAIHIECRDGQSFLKKASLLRTARLLMQGQVMISKDLWTRELAK